MRALSFSRIFRRQSSDRDQRQRIKPTVELLEDRQLPSGTPFGLGMFLASNTGFPSPAPKVAASTPVQSTVVYPTASHSTINHSQWQTPVVATAAAAVAAKQPAIVDGTRDPSTPAAATKATVKQAGASQGTATRTITVDFGSGTTDWSQTKTAPQFDPSLGTLSSVTITNSGSLTSHIRVESLDSAPADVTGTVSGNLTLSGNVLSSPVITATNAETEDFQASAYDGLSDFGGTSGHDFGDKLSSGTQTLLLTSASDLAKFIGKGQVSLTETAHATSSASGAGNLLTQVNSTAQANLIVVYNYTPPPVTVTSTPSSPPANPPVISSIIPMSKRMFLASTFRHAG